MTTTELPPVMPTYARADLAFTEGKGSWLYAKNGESYLDAGGGIAVNALGHAHPELVETLQKQAEKLWHTSNLYHVPNQTALAERLVAHSFADSVFVTNSGTEATECAVKTARKHFSHNGQPEKYKILTINGSFHGRTMAMIAAAGSEKLTSGYGPLTPGFQQVPPHDIPALTSAIDAETAAIMVEPVLGEGGIIPLSDQYLQSLRQICDDNNLLLIFDEIQCGIGRTGRLFAHEWAGITPDIMPIAKGIGGGFPLGACLATSSAADGMGPGSHGSTYGGNPLACAVGCKLLDIVTEPDFLESVRRKSGLLRQKLESLVAGHPSIFSEVRGSGLMLGIVCVPPNTDVVSNGYTQNILTVPGGDNVIRLLPPLTISDEDISEMVSRLDATATAMENAS